MPNTSKPYKSYASSQEDSKDLLRHNVVDVADHLITTEGIGSLTVRRIADELDASTKVIYSLFGGKDGLANELYQEGSLRLRQYMYAVEPHDDVATYITNSCWAYWEFAQVNSSYYELMFGNAIPNFEPSPENMQHLITAFAKFEQTLEDYVSEGKLESGDLVETIHYIWASLHGVISLQHARFFTEDQAIARYKKSIAAIINFLSIK